MSTPAASPRPSQVTVAGWVVAISGVMLVVGVFDAMSGLRSVDTREEVTRLVTTGALQGFGLSVEDVLEIMRWMLFVAGAAAAAAAILGIFVLQRNSGARIGLSVAAVLVVLSSPASDGFLGMLVAAGTVVLWTQPARDWFAGRAPRPVERPVERPAPPAVPPAVQQPPVHVGPGDQAGPPPTVGWGQVPPNPYAGPPQPWPSPAPRGPGAPLPGQLRLACILTWVFSGLTALGYLLVLVALWVDSDRLLEMLRDSPSWDASWDDDLVVTAAVVASTMFLVWCTAAAVLAFLVWRGSRWAWIALTVSAVVAALVATLAFPFSILHMAATSASAGMLLARASRTWFVRR